MPHRQIRPPIRHSSSDPLADATTGSTDSDSSTDNYALNDAQYNMRKTNWQSRRPPPQAITHRRRPMRRKRIRPRKTWRTQEARTRPTRPGQRHRTRAGPIGTSKPPIRTTRPRRATPTILPGIQTMLPTRRCTPKLRRMRNRPPTDYGEAGEYGDALGPSDEATDETPGRKPPRTKRRPSTRRRPRTTR